MIEIAQSCAKLILTQQKYILDLLTETNHIQRHKNATPIEDNYKLLRDENESRGDTTSYQKLIGKLFYIFLIQVLTDHMQSMY